MEFPKKISFISIFLFRRKFNNIIFYFTFPQVNFTQEQGELDRWKYFPSVKNMPLLGVTLSFISEVRDPALTILSKMRSAICSRDVASMSNMTVPFNKRLRSSNKEWSESVATWGFDHLFPPSSTSSSNLIHLQKIKDEKKTRTLTLICSFNFAFDQLNKRMFKMAAIKSRTWQFLSTPLRFRL